MGERASMRVMCCFSHVLQIHTGWNSFIDSDAARYELTICKREARVAKRQSSTSIASFQVSKMYAVCVPKRRVQSIRLHSLSSPVSVRFDGVRYLWHMHYGLLTSVETRASSPVRFSRERTKKVIALSYVEHAFQRRSVTDTRHTSSYDEMYFRGR